MGIVNNARFFFQQGPLHLLFYPTSQCNLFCKHCFNYDRQDNLGGDTGRSDELSLDEIEQISYKFGNLKSLTVTGGEPFLRKDIVEIIGTFYKNNGVRYVSVHTNGLLKARASRAVKALLEEYKDLIIIFCTSIDGVAEEHNEYRGAPNGFAKTVDTIKEIEEIKRSQYPERLFLLSSTMFSAATQDKYIATIDFIDSNFEYLNPKSCFIRGEVRDNQERSIEPSFFHNYVVRAENSVDKSVPSFSLMALKETVEALTPRVVLNNHRKKVQTVPCMAGRKMVVLYENGDVYPCEMLSKDSRFGNIRDVDYDIKKLLFSETGNQIKNRINPGKQCNCTWENAINISMLFDIRSYPKILSAWFKLFVLGRANSPRVNVTAINGR